MTLSKRQNIGLQASTYKLLDELRFAYSRPRRMDSPHPPARLMSWNTFLQLLAADVWEGSVVCPHHHRRYRCEHCFREFAEASE